MSPSQLVSIIIRSNGGVGLHAAVRAAAAQSWPSVEVIVVDMTGHPDSAWPSIEWQSQRTIRRISCGQRLGAARAGNVGIEAASGEFFCLLDDGDCCPAGYVEAMMDAAQQHPRALVIYSRCRIAASAHAAETLLGRPLNRELFLHDRLVPLQAAVIRRKVVELGCRFDERLELGAEPDFLEQIAAHGDFVFLPHLAPMVTTARAGSDKAAEHNAAAISRRIYFDNLRFAKWSGERLYHSLRAAHACARASARSAAGDHEGARLAYERVLAAYPGNPDALHGLAVCDLEAARLESARDRVGQAMEFDPTNVDYRATAAIIEQRLFGGGIAAGVTPATARAFPGWPASPMSQPPTIAPVISASVVAQALVVPRGSPCPCGSSKRYKQCCGKLGAAAAAIGHSPEETLLRDVQSLLQAGEATAAASALSGLWPRDVGSARVAQQAGQAYMQMHLLQPALALFDRAIELGGGQRDALAACDECCHLMFRAIAWQSASRTLRTLLDRLNARAAECGPEPLPIHIVGKLDTVGGTERRALNLYRRLSTHGRVGLWTTATPMPAYGDVAALQTVAPGNAPARGTVVLIGTYFDCGDWLETAAFDRVIICHNLAEQYPGLMQRLIQIEQNPHRPRVELVFPSELFRATVGLPGRVEYSSVDVDAFRRRRPPNDHGAHIVVGRHGRAYPLKFHPNDPAFFRTLMGKGYRVRILGGTPIAPAFADPASAHPELLEVEQEPVQDFLERLDIFVYRKHPRFFETGGTAILEAMAMELPVVVFAEECGVAELIRDGHNGFLVDSEGQAIALIDRLAADCAWRERIGRAARATIVELMSRQMPGMVDYYLGAAAEPAAEKQVCAGGS